MGIIVAVFTNTKIFINIENHIRQTDEDIFDAINAFWYFFVFFVRFDLKGSLYSNFANLIKLPLSNINNDFVVETWVHEKKGYFKIHKPDLNIWCDWST